MQDEIAVQQEHAQEEMAVYRWHFLEVLDVLIPVELAQDPQPGVSSW